MANQNTIKPFPLPQELCAVQAALSAHHWFYIPNQADCVNSHWTNFWHLTLSSSDLILRDFTISIEKLIYGIKIGTRGHTLAHIQQQNWRALITLWWLDQVRSEAILSDQSQGFCLQQQMHKNSVRTRHISCDTAPSDLQLRQFPAQKCYLQFEQPQMNSSHIFCLIHWLHFTIPI